MLFEHDKVLAGACHVVYVVVCILYVECVKGIIYDLLHCICSYGMLYYSIFGCMFVYFLPEHKKVLFEHDKVLASACHVVYVVVCTRGTLRVEYVVCVQGIIYGLLHCICSYDMLYYSIFGCMFVHYFCGMLLLLLLCGYAVCGCVCPPMPLPTDA